jgi:hypothetical protein
VETWKNQFQGKLNRRHIHTVMERNVKKSLPVVKIPRSVSRGSTDLNECDNNTRQ